MTPSIGFDVRDCAACGAALWGERAVCHRCGAPVAGKGSPGCKRWVSQLRDAWTPSSEPLAVCRGCGVVATRRGRCRGCGHDVNPLAAPARLDGAVWARVELELQCRRCWLAFPVRTIDERGAVACPRCAFATGAHELHSALRHVHDAVDLAGPSSEGRHRAAGEPLSIAHHNRYVDLGVRRSSVRFTLPRTQRRGALAATVSPGVPLCASCRSPCDVEHHHDGAAQLLCARCGPLTPTRAPADLTAGYYALRAVVPDGQGPPTDDPRRTPHDGSPFRAPARSTSNARPPVAAAGRWWMLFDAPSLGREALAERVRGSGPPSHREAPPRERRSTFWPTVVAGSVVTVVSSVSLGVGMGAPVVGPFIGSALCLGYLIAICLVENRFPLRR